MSTFNGNEKFSEDTFLDKATDKTALIVVAHDDDAIGCAGTVTELTKKGWKVYLLTFYGHWKAEDNPIRKKEVAKVITIEKYKPTVVFSLDNITGAYGHPEHVCVSQCVIDVCSEMKNSAGFSVKKIYQSIYTKTLNETFFADNSTYIAAKKSAKSLEIL